MTPCPRCNKPGGVMLFTSIAPCDRCVGPANGARGLHDSPGWVRSVGFVDGVSVHVFRASERITVPNGSTHAAWLGSISLATGDQGWASIRALLSYMSVTVWALDRIGATDRLRTGEISGVNEFRCYWTETP